MLTTLASVASLLLSYGLLLLGNGLFTTLLGVRTKLEGFPTEMVGAIVAGYFVGFLLGALFTVRVIAGVGHIRAFAAFASVMSVSALIPVLWIDPLVWLVTRLVAGYSMAGMITVTESWLNERADNETRGRVFSFYMITNFLAAGCGQLLLPLADPGEFQLFSVASIVFSLALVPVLLTRATSPTPVTPQPVRLGQIYRTSPLGLAGAMSAGLVNATFYGLGPVFAHGIGLSTTYISLFMASAIMGGLVFQWPVGRLSDRLDRRRVLTMAAALTALACTAIVMVATAPVSKWLFAASVLYGGFSFTIYSVSAAHANDFSPPDRLVQTTSGLLIAYGVGASCGPLLAAAVMGRVGPPGLFVFSAAVNVALALFAVGRMFSGRIPARAERTRFQALPAGHLTSQELYTALKDARDRDIARLSGHF
ncbi:MAG: MFS transporter [Gammaproteobacteria bacterium]|nr:MFS transporter [Gammaproteobacteria bacterium]NIR81801.1 MFS transporter [Gammaproteobacteria bacterium]NIR88633.1 MFS transporter [Gammaproteobacteria bacterium]NIU02909.1 MFS transporter [Gammaproteobacteria bacterium]NIV50430.1 MFS transporter [Gammaproteobacteria bacterium]